MNPKHLKGHELIYYLHQKIKCCFNTYLKGFLQRKHSNQFEELYKIEKEMVVWMIQEILKTNEYTLDGIANHTRIPFDIISDAAIGMQKNVSIVLWFKIADIFLQLRSDKCCLDIQTDF